MTKNKQSIRHCELVTHIDSEEDIRRIKDVLLKHSSAIKQWSYIIHDKDEVEQDHNIEESDNKQEVKYKHKHIHLIIKFNQVQKLEYVAKWFDVQPNFISKIKGNWNDANLYLIHANAPEKHQYDVSEVVANYDYKDLIKLLSIDTKELIEKILEGKLVRADIGGSIPPYIYIKHKKLFENAFEVADELYLKEHMNDPVTVFYICGPSNTGKTTLAQMLAKNLSGGVPCISSSSNDPLENYKGQESLILDDLRPGVFELADLLKLLDPHLRSSVKSRYHNKVLRCKYIFITSVLSIDDFFKNMYLNDNEPVTQFKRRCKYYIQVTHKRITTFVWSDIDNTYYPIPSVANQIVEVIRKKNDLSDPVTELIENQNFIKDTIKILME